MKMADYRRAATELRQFRLELRYDRMQLEELQDLLLRCPPRCMADHRRMLITSHFVAAYKFALPGY